MHNIDIIDSRRDLFPFVVIWRWHWYWRL